MCRPLPAPPPVLGEEALVVLVEAASMEVLVC